MQRDFPSSSSLRHPANSWLGCVLLTSLMLVLAQCPLSAAEPDPTKRPTPEAFFLKPGETVVFFGDSITQSGQYINYVEAYLRTRFPNQTFPIINRGISSETISGTTEEDHDPPRPHADKRFTRDITGSKPDVVIACFGMNDGNYYPFERVRYQAYQTGVRRLIARTRDEAKARALVLMTPPPFDPYRRKSSDPEATTFGYKYAAIDYDTTLHNYSEWLITLRKEGFVVADVHAASNAHLQARRAEKVSFHLAPDAVHPNSTGHWLMAQTLLLALHAPADVAAATVHVASLESKDPNLTDLKLADGVLSFTWKTPLPMPHDPTWDAKSIELERVSERLNRYRLEVTGLGVARYQFKAGEEVIAEVTRDQLAGGLDLNSLPQFPTVKAAGQVLTLVQERRAITYAFWRKQIAASPAPTAEEAAALEKRTGEIDAELKRLCMPQTLALQLVPVP